MTVPIRGRVSVSYYKPFCVSIYEANIFLPSLVTCGLGEDVVLNRASNAAFVPQCLCNSGGFLQDAPGCIQCLFEHPDKDVTHRSMLLAMIETCVDEYNVIPCPRDCAPISSLITYCEGIDGAHRAGAPPPDPRYLPPPIGIAGVDNDTFPCICREGYKNMVDTCFNCVKKWEITRALKWQGTTRQCAPPKSKTSQRPTTSQGPRGTKTQRPPASSIAQGDISGVLKDSTRTNAPSQLTVEVSGGKYASVVPVFLLFSWIVGVFVAALILI